MLKDASPNGIALDDLFRILKEPVSTVENGPPEESVHCARVQSKRLAAALHLFKGVIPKSEYRSELKQLKKASQLLARRRDLDVIRKRLWSATRHLSPKDQREIKEWLAVRIPHPGVTTPQQLHRATAQLSETLRVWPKPQGVEAAKLFDRGTAKSFQKAKKAFQKAKKTCKPDDFHRWRIWTKRLFLQLRLASSLQLRPINAKVKKLDKLQSKLGDLHDLQVTREFIATERRGPKTPLKRLEKRLKQDQNALRQKAIKQGQKLFKGIPKQRPSDRKVARCMAPPKKQNA